MISLVVLTAILTPTVYRYPATITVKAFRYVAHEVSRELGYVFDSKDMECLVKIVDSESDFRPWLYNGGTPYKRNGHSSAYGLFQGLKDTYKNYGRALDYGVPCVVRQMRFGLKYIVSRYGSPKRAWRFRLAHGYY